MYYLKMMILNNYFFNNNYSVIKIHIIFCIKYKQTGPFEILLTTLSKEYCI